MLCDTSLFGNLQSRDHGHLLDYKAIISITRAVTGLLFLKHLSDDPFINGLMNCNVL